MSLQFTVYILIELFVACLGHPLDDSKFAKILKFDHEDFGKGPYRYGFKSSDGIIKEESGEIHYPGTEHEFMKVVGMFTYPGPDGVMYEVRYTADDQGFHPEGDHIKVPPFVPWIHHPHSDDNNDIIVSGTEQNSDEIKTTPKPNIDYLSSTLSSTTYLPPRGTTPKNDYTTVGLISPPITSGSNLLSSTKPQYLLGENSLKRPNGTPDIQFISEGSFPAANTVNVPSQSKISVGGNALKGIRSFPSQIIPGDKLTPSVTIEPVPGIKLDLSKEKTPSKLLRIIQDHFLSTPRPNPDINFHSTAESQTYPKYATPKPNRFMSNLRESKSISKKMVIIAAKK